MAELPVLRPEDTGGIACDLINGNEHVLATLQDQGACDLSFSLPDRCRFRVNIFRQRNTYAIVMRMIASQHSQHCRAATCRRRLPIRRR